MGEGGVEFLRLTGHPRATLASDEIDFVPDKRYQLLCYLAYDSGWVGRERAAFLFWPDADTDGSRQNLRGLLQRLRTLPFAPSIEADKHQLRWDVQTDFKIFNEAAERGDVDVAIDSYHGPLLEGLESDDAGEFSGWLEIAREELRSRWRALTLVRMAQLAPGDELTADNLLRRLIDSDSLDEEAVRTYMLAMASLGQLGSARSAYREFAARLEREMELAPTSETVAAFEALRELDEAPTVRLQPKGRRPAGAAREESAEAPTNGRFNQFPTPATTFIGREMELVEIVERLRDSECRLLSLVGQGGVGKTRLALAAAALLIDEYPDNFPDGVLFVALDVTHSADEILPTLADALGIEPTLGEELYPKVAKALREAQVLLIFDNFEHVLSGVDLVSRLLEEAPAVKVLATTRERLGLEAEWTYQVEGLDYPATAIAFDDLRTFGAVRLLVDRARRVRQDFRLVAEDLPELERLWSLTEGLPLAIELTAAWLRAVPLATLVRDISENLDLLTTVSRDAQPRHMSMQAVFEQSWSQLTEPERSALRRLAVFNAPVSPAAAAYVAEAERVTMAALIDKSLIRLDRNGRYDRHPLLFSYTRQKLAQVAAEQAATEERHSAYYLRFLRERTDRARSGQVEKVMREIASEVREVNSALRRAAANHRSGEIVAFMQLLELDIEYFRARGYSDETLTMLSTAADAALEAGDVETARDLRGRLGDAFGIHRGDEERARKEYQTAAELARLSQDRAREAVFVSLSGVMLSSRDKGAGWVELDRALALAREVGDGLALSKVLENRAYMLSQGKDYVEARRNLSESLAVIEDSQTTGSITAYELARRRYYSIMNIGELDYKLGHLEKAEAAKRRALEIAEHMSNPILEAHAHYGIGEIYAETERPEDAIRHLEVAVSLYLENNVTAHLEPIDALVARHGYELSIGAKEGQLMGT